MIIVNKVVQRDPDEIPPQPGMYGGLARAGGIQDLHGELARKRAELEEEHGDQLEERIQHLRDQFDIAAGIDAGREGARQLDQMALDFGKLREGQARDKMLDTFHAIEDTVSSMGSALKNDTQRQAYENRIAPYRHSALGFLSDHALRELREWQHRQEEDDLNSALDSYAFFAGRNPEAEEAFLGQVDDTLKRRAAREHWTGEFLETAKGKLRIHAHSLAIDRLIQEQQPQQAREYFETLSAARPHPKGAHSHNLHHVGETPTPPFAYSWKSSRPAKISRNSHAGMRCRRRRRKSMTASARSPM